VGVDNIACNMNSSSAEGGNLDLKFIKYILPAILKDFVGWINSCFEALPWLI